MQEYLKGQFRCNERTASDEQGIHSNELTKVQIVNRASYVNVHTHTHTHFDAQKIVKSHMFSLLGIQLHPWTERFEL